LNNTSNIRYHEYKQHNLEEILDLNEFPREFFLCYNFPYFKNELDQKF